MCIRANETVWKPEGREPWKVSCAGKVSEATVARRISRVGAPTHATASRSAKALELVKKYDVERRTRRTRRRTLTIFSAGSAVSALYVISSHALKPSRYFTVGTGVESTRPVSAEESHATKNTKYSKSTKRSFCGGGVCFRWS